MSEVTITMESGRWASIHTLSTYAQQALGMVPPAVLETMPEDQRAIIRDMAGAVEELTAKFFAGGDDYYIQWDGRSTELLVLTRGGATVGMVKRS